MISTIETFCQQCNQEEAEGSKVWGPGIHDRGILDEAHRLRTSRTPIGKFRKANRKLVNVDRRDYNMDMASCILSLEPQYKWMLMPTPLANGIEDLRWILRFLESSCWLTLQLPPNTFNHTLTIDDDWVADRTNVSGNESGVGFMPVADLYKKGPELGSLVHRTIIGWDTYMLHIIGEVGKSKQATQT